MTTLRPCDAIAHPAMIDATLKAAEPAPRTPAVLEGKWRGAARGDQGKGIREICCRGEGRRAQKLTANKGQKEPAPGGCLGSPEEISVPVVAKQDTLVPPLKVGSDIATASTGLLARSPNCS